MASRETRILILCKTYPSPSKKHSETSCVAGIEEGGKFIRLFPVPFRLIDDESQFKKWQWINVRVRKARDDHRPESHNIYTDTIRLEGDPMPAGKGWGARLKHLTQAAKFDSFIALDAARQSSVVTLGVVCPARILGLDIAPADRPEWTPDELETLRQSENQAGMFEPEQKRQTKILKKLPFDFHYRYVCEVGGEAQEHRHKVVDWEAGALYWRCRRSHGGGWEAPFRAQYEQALPSRDIMFLMGTIHRFPDQWLIVSVIAPPKPQLSAEASPQLNLGL